MLAAPPGAYYTRGVDVPRLFSQFGVSKEEGHTLRAPFFSLEYSLSRLLKSSQHLDPVLRNISGDVLGCLFFATALRKFVT